MRKVLFLDFDGVLHPASGSHMPEFARAPMLAAVLEGAACDVVISSTWRDHYPLEHLKTLLPPSLAGKVVATLGPDCRGPHVRFVTICEWVAQHSPDSDWRALDDSGSEFPQGCANLILCDGRTGLDDRQLSALKEWLDLTGR